MIGVYFDSDACLHAMTGYFANSAMSFAFSGLVTLPVFMGVAFYGCCILWLFIGYYYRIFNWLSIYFSLPEKIKLAEVDQPESSNINN